MSLGSQTADRSQDTLGTLRKFWIPLTEFGQKIVQPFIPIEAEAPWQRSGDALVKFHEFKAAAGGIYEAVFANYDSQDLWYGVVDKGSDPEDGDSLWFPWAVPAGRSGYYHFPAYFRFSSGCQIVGSTTPNVVTLPATSKSVIHARVI